MVEKYAYDKNFILFFISPMININYKNKKKQQKHMNAFVPHDPLAYPSAELYHEEWSEWLPVT